MGESLVISALKAKRVELSSDLRALMLDVECLEDKIRHIDASIKIFDPDFDLSVLKPKRRYRKSKFFDHGESARLILEILRDSITPLTIRNIFDAILKRKSLDLPHKDDERAVINHLAIAIKRQEKIGHVEQCGVVSGPGNSALWRIKPLDEGV